MLFKFFLQHCSRRPVGDHDWKCQGYSVNRYLSGILNMVVPTITAMGQLSTDGIEPALINARFASPLDW